MLDVCFQSDGYPLACRAYAGKYGPQCDAREPGESEAGGTSRRREFRGNRGILSPAPDARKHRG